MIRYNTTSTLFEFFQNGVWVNFTPVSDGRLKTDVVPVDHALDIVNQLNPVFFNWDQNNPRSQGFGTKHQVGFIAQEVEKVLPEVVNKGEDTYRSVEYGKIVAVAIASIKELYNEFKGLVARVMNIEGKTVLNERAIASVKAEAKAENAAKDKVIAKLKKDNAEVKARLDKIEKMLLKK